MPLTVLADTATGVPVQAISTKPAKSLPIHPPCSITTVAPQIANSHHLHILQRSATFNNQQMLSKFAANTIPQEMWKAEQLSEILCDINA